MSCHKENIPYNLHTDEEIEHYQTSEVSLAMSLTNFISSPK